MDATPRQCHDASASPCILIYPFHRGVLFRSDVVGSGVVKTKTRVAGSRFQTRLTCPWTTTAFLAARSRLLRDGSARTLERLNSQWHLTLDEIVWLRKRLG